MTSQPSSAAVDTSLLVVLHSHSLAIVLISPDLSFASPHPFAAAMPSADKKPKTLYDKVLDAHIVNEQEDGTILLYIGGLRMCFFCRSSSNRFYRQTSRP